MSVMIKCWGVSVIRDIMPAQMSKKYTVLDLCLYFTALLQVSVQTEFCLRLDLLFRFEHMWL